MSVALVIPPWHELDLESVSLELRKPGGGLSLDDLSHPFDTILRAGLVIDPGSRYLTLDQLHNTLGIALDVANTQVLYRRQTGQVILYYLGPRDNISDPAIYLGVRISWGPTVQRNMIDR